MELMSRGGYQAARRMQGTTSRSIRPHRPQCSCLGLVHRTCSPLRGAGSCTWRALIGWRARRLVLFVVAPAHLTQSASRRPHVQPFKLRRRPRGAQEAWSGGEVSGLGPSSCFGAQPWTPQPLGVPSGARGRARGPAWGLRSLSRAFPFPNLRLHAGAAGVKTWGLQGREAQGTLCSVPRRPFFTRNGGCLNHPGRQARRPLVKRFGPPP
ncbi:hypothetical protein HispidOSU_027441 [Sigmodon hispidus]